MEEGWARGGGHRVKHALCMHRAHDGVVDAELATDHMLEMFMCRQGLRGVAASDVRGSMLFHRVGEVLRPSYGPRFLWSDKNTRNTLKTVVLD